jgi:phosphoenolpyruvate-protein phosphotransferase
VKLIVRAPLDGWALPLAEVPDEVFATAMAGDGVAIDPTSDVVCAPFDGELVAVGNARHAVSLRNGDHIEVLIHVGIDTVALNGEGFEWLAKPGGRVASGAPLLRFDLDRLARRAKSVATPIVLSAGGIIAARVAGRSVAVGDALFEVEVMKGTGTPRQRETAVASASMVVPFDHGLHVRPAALIASALKPFHAEVDIVLRGRAANARSGVALMALGARCADTVEVHARGGDARAALDALAKVLAPVAAARPLPAKRSAPVKGRIQGVVASPGIVAGTVARIDVDDEAVPESAGDAQTESRRLGMALDELENHLEELARRASGPSRELLQGHANLVRDPELARAAAAHVRAGKSAGQAWRDATRATAASLAAMDDARMRERAADLRDLERQLLRVLRGASPSSSRQLAPQSIVVADDLLPSQFMALDASCLAGLCLARGGATSHVSILAASSAIPALVAAGPEVLGIAEGTAVILDAQRGWIEVEPAPAELEAVRRGASERAAEAEAQRASATQGAVTRDGITIAVKANAASIADARAAVANGAEGCGLLRTEFLFHDRSDPPGEDEQAAEYVRIAEAFGGAPVNVRTLDIGGDKPIAYLTLPREENPALGLRGVRTSLAYPQLLRTQLRAIARASATTPCRILVPMVNEVEELAAVRAMAIECARDVGVAVPPIGIMVETPAAALGSHALARDADFLSIGSNDLTQYSLAIDRGHPDLARRVDSLHPAVLLLIAATVEGASRHARPVSVCGAMASDAQALPFLIGLGVTEISATPASIPRLKAAIRGLDAARCRELAGRALDAQGAQAVREMAP